MINKIDIVGKEKYAQKHDFLRFFQEKIAPEASKMVLMQKMNYKQTRAKTFEIGSQKRTKTEIGSER